LTGNPAREGGKATPDPKEMLCNDQRKADPDSMNWDYIHISAVKLDEKGEKTFKDGRHWPVPLVCGQVSQAEMKCLFDGIAPEK